MITEYQDGVVLMIGWNPRTEEHDLIVASPNWDSLRARAGQTIRIDLHFNGRLVEFDDWWDPGAEIRINERGMEAIAASWPREHAEDFAVSLSLASGMSIRSEERTIGNYNLAGSQKALLAVIHCGAKIMREGRDPFAG